MIPADVIELEIRPIEFNEKFIKKLYVDLDHINHGKEKKNKRSSLTIDQVLKLAFQLDGLHLEAEALNGNYFYYSLNLIDDRNKTYRMIFCHDGSFEWIGIITLYRVKV